MSDHAQGVDVWHQLSAEALEREYSPSSCIGGNYLPFVMAYQTRSAEARTQCSEQGATWQRIQYGSTPEQRLELCLPPPGKAPSAKPGLLIFIHGGYWQELSADDSLFAATGCVQHGLAFAALNYTLAPDASVPDIVAECRLAVAWLQAHANELGFDPARIVVAGSSAGAHLAAMVALPRDTGPVPAPIHAAVLVSGIYALEPLIGTSVNVALGLNAATARQVSPALQPLRGFPQALVCWGANETAEFKRQSRGFAADLAAQGTPCEVFEVEGRNHFDVIMDLADTHAVLGRKSLALLQDQSC